MLAMGALRKRSGFGRGEFVVTTTDAWLFGAGRPPSRSSSVEAGGVGPLRSEAGVACRLMENGGTATAKPLATELAECNGGKYRCPWRDVGHGCASKEGGLWPR